MDVINGNGTCGHDGFVEGEIIVAGPAPLVWLFYQTFADGIVMHVIQAFPKLLGVADKPVPKLMLPSRPARAIPTIDLQRRNPFHVPKDVRNGDRKMREDERVPVIGHENVAAEQETKALALLRDGLSKDSILRFLKMPLSEAEIGCDEEDLVGGFQTLHVGHGEMVSPVATIAAPFGNRGFFETTFHD
jgi:hypothetical protein